jgi:large subunit ribosomal protein L15
MQLHTISSKTKQKTKKHIGRGGKRGTTSGRGTKGQKARSGHKIRPEIRDIIKRIPKLRGRGKHSFVGHAKEIFSFDLDFVSNHFEAGQTVNARSLRLKNFIPNQKTKPEIKILGSGALKKKLVFEGLLYSASAREKIKEAGGTVK